MNTLAPLTDIKSCGSHWAGEDLSTIDDLIEVLKAHPLDRTFENCGNFASVPEWIKDNPYPERNMIEFLGNFLTVSFGFTIYSDDPAIIEKLRGRWEKVTKANAKTVASNSEICPWSLKHPWAEVQDHKPAGELKSAESV